MKIPKKLKMKLVLRIVWYIFFSNFIFDVFMFLKIFFWILLNILWVWVYREKFNIDFLAQNFFLASIHV